MESPCVAWHKSGSRSNHPFKFWRKTVPITRVVSSWKMTYYEHVAYITLIQGTGSKEQRSWMCLENKLFAEINVVGSWPVPQRWVPVLIRGGECSVRFIQLHLVVWQVSFGVLRFSVPNYHSTEAPYLFLYHVDDNRSIRSPSFKKRIVSSLPKEKNLLGIRRSKS